MLNLLFYTPQWRVGISFPDQMFMLFCFCCGHSDHGYNGETWTSTASGADPYPVLPRPSDPQLDLSALVSLETDSDGEEGKEETIVYLWKGGKTSDS